MKKWRIFIVSLVVVSASLPVAGAAGDQLRIATYNVQNYLIEDRRVDGRWRSQYPKPESEKAALRKVLTRIDADVVVLQEMGSEPFLQELQDDLRTDGLEYPFGYVHQASDEKRHLAVISRIPFQILQIEVRDFPYFEERLLPKRGLLAVQFDLEESSFILFGVHLKSRYTDFREDPQSRRRRASEARVIRDAIRRAFPPETKPRYLLAGDFNDNPSSSALGYFQSVGDLELSRLVAASDSRGHVWTHFYSRDQTYTRIDGFLASPQLFDDLQHPATIDDGPGSDEASDHRAVWVNLNIQNPISRNPPKPDHSSKIAQ